jgi:hypothetical protein
MNNIKENTDFERLKYLGMTNQNYIHEEIRRGNFKERLLPFSSESCLPMCYLKT